RAAFLAAEADVELPPLPAWEAHREELLEQLERAVSGAEFCADGAAAAALEQEFSGTWRGLQVRGVVDGIDRVPGGLALVDYKSCARAPDGIPDADGSLRVDLQLPLYTEAAAPVLFPGEPVADACYY